MNALVDPIARGLAAGARSMGKRQAQSIGMLASAAPRATTLPCFTVAGVLPTLTETDGGSGASFSPNARVTPGAGVFRVTGTPTRPWTEVNPAFYVPTTTGGALAIGTHVVWEWVADAAVIELLLIGFTSSLDLTVDGMLVQSTAFTTTASGSYHLIKLDWSGAADPRRPRSYRISGFNLPFGGLYLDPAGSAWYPGDRTSRRLMAVIGDSYTQGTGAPTTARGWAGAAAEQLGLDLWTDGIGGSGWLSTGSSAPAARVAARLGLLTRGPDFIVTALGYNDSGGSDTAIAAGYDATIAAARAAWPEARILTLGPWTPTGSTTGLAAVKATLMARAAAAGAAFVDIEGLVTAANKTLYTGGDNVHPTMLGHEYVGRRIAHSLAPIVAG